MTSHLNRLIETLQMRGHNIGFCAELTKIIPNYHQILPNHHQYALLSRALYFILDLCRFFLQATKTANILFFKAKAGYFICSQFTCFRPLNTFSRFQSCSVSGQLSMMKFLIMTSYSTVTICSSWAFCNQWRYVSSVRGDLRNH